MSDLDKILANLTRPIPAPPRAKPKPQKSWMSLKPGDRLRTILPLELPEGEIQPPFTMTIDRCDSQGVDLVSEDGRHRIRWEDRKWGEMFIKVRRRPGAA